MPGIRGRACMTPLVGHESCCDNWGSAACRPLRLTAFGDVTDAAHAQQLSADRKQCTRPPDDGVVPNPFTLLSSP